MVNSGFEMDMEMRGLGFFPGPKLKPVLFFSVLYQRAEVFKLINMICSNIS